MYLLTDKSNQMSQPLYQLEESQPICQSDPNWGLRANRGLNLPHLRDPATCGRVGVYRAEKVE